MPPKNPKIPPIPIINSIINDYCLAHSSPLPAELYHIETYTKKNILAHRMLSNHLQAHLLIAISQMIQPGKILEIGTFTGYSAICLAQGLSTKGQLITIEKNKEFVSIAQNFFHEYNYHNIHTLHGDALQIIPHLSKKFDLIYLDGDKEKYYEYYEQLLPRLSKNAWMLIDNTLWKGLVADTPKEPLTKKLQAFNTYLHSQSHQIFHIILPIRDGITLIRKK